MMPLLSPSSSNAPFHQLSLLKGTSAESTARLMGIGKQTQYLQPQPLSILSCGGGRPGLPAAFRSVPKKPMRPLTAYHIFFQIEREYVIQTTAGEDADKSIHDRKVYLSDVPQRYRNIKLLPDWYAGPGKRQKRKHRKQHGKIGFLELSRVISTRWAQLEKVDPETKAFVQRIAKQELDEYYREMKAYKEAIKGSLPEEFVRRIAASQRPAAPTKKATKKRPSSQITPSAMQQQLLQQQQLPSMVPLRPEAVPSLCQGVDFKSRMRPDSVQVGSVDFASDPCSAQLQRDVDEFLSRIDSNTMHLLPSSIRGVGDQSPMVVENQISRRDTLHRQVVAPKTLQSFDSQFGGSGCVEKPRKQRRTVGNALCVSPPLASEVDICDDEILQLWKSNN